MTYTKKGGAMYELVNRIVGGLPYKSVSLNAVAGATRGGFTSQVFSSIKTRKSFSGKIEKGKVFTVSIDGRYLFSDLITILHLPDNTNGRVETMLINRALKNAKFYVAISETTASEFKEKFGNKEVFVVKLGVDPHVQLPRDEHEGIVVSHVGGISEGDSRRLPMLQIPSVLRLAFPDKRITFTHIGGRDNSNEQALYKACIDNDIIPDFKSNVPTEEVWAAYAKSDLYIYMSTKEGYSLTPMEALMMGTPCLISDIAVHREIYGGIDGVNFVRNGDVSPQDVKNAYELGPSPKYREFALKRTWADTISEFDAVIRKVA